MYFWREKHVSDFFSRVAIVRKMEKVSKMKKEKIIPMIFSVFCSTEQSTDVKDTAKMTVFICRTDGIQCDGGISCLSDADRIRYRCRHQASPATKKVHCRTEQ